MDKETLKIYFCGSIRGGRTDQELYHELISYLKLFGSVLTEHIGEKELKTDMHLPAIVIYQRDMDWLDSADIVIAEVSTPSLGVGFEIAKSVSMNKKILCLSKSERNDNLSAIISGCPNLQLAVYSGITEAKSAIRIFIGSALSR